MFIIIWPLIVPAPVSDARGDLWITFYDTHIGYNKLDGFPELEAPQETWRIIDIIQKWLKAISVMNSYFIQQITKIKIDKLLALKKREDNK